MTKRTAIKTVRALAQAIIRGTAEQQARRYDRRNGYIVARDNARMAAQAFELATGKVKP